MLNRIIDWALAWTHRTCGDDPRAGLLSMVMGTGVSVTMALSFDQAHVQWWMPVVGPLLLVVIGMAVLCRCPDCPHDEVTDGS